MRTISKLALAIAFALPTVAQAQTPLAPDQGELKFGGDISSNGKVAGYQVGPYQAQIKGFEPMLADVMGNNFTVIWCVDFTHVAGPTNAWDSYYATAFDDNTGVVGNGVYDKTRKGNDELYRQAAWLIEQYDPTADLSSGAGLFNAKNIQGTIWNLFGAGLAADGTKSFYGLTVAAEVELARDWFILTDKYYGGDVGGDNQEFLTSRPRAAQFSSVPEPSTYALMASGLLALAVVARRRRTVVES